VQNGLDIVFHAFKKYAFSRIHTKKNGHSQIRLGPLSDQLFIIIMSTLLKTREKDVHKIFIVLAHGNNSLRVDILLHSGHIILINAACLAEKQQIPILQSLV
jgi:hypothetical protein